ncbi:MAG TPA: ABC transporter ATP-binding protein, partial [Phycisphaeraceae bacterium]|nr:ABC transporter ATP-binding protein [Phycisphaeraceae bacterium]
MSDLLLRITNLTLEFDIYGKENRFHRNIGQKLHLIRSHHIQSFKALDNVSMTVRRGERVAIMGHNGAGKSSLLKVIAGVYHVEKGKVELNGSIAPLIELGAGFNSTLSARKNIILNGAMFGYPRREMIAKTPEILQFSGLNEFADVPIKNYSSGMRRRLAFTIATDMHPDLLIIDEIFAGGDLQFVGRARARMQDLMGRANALLMVSHNLNLLEQFCERGIWLHKGKIRMEGPVSQVTAAYRASVPAPAVIPGESTEAVTQNGKTNTNSEVIKVKDRDETAEPQPEILFDPRDPMHVQPTQGLWERVTTCHCGGRVVPCAIAPWSICKRCRSWVNVHRLKKEALPRLLSLDPRPVGVYSPGISRYLSSNKDVDFEPLVSTLDFENKAIPRVTPGARIAHIGCGSGELLKLLENKS